ncbi:MAG: membrane protein insertase YidC [Thermodesulfovibrionales bacterium]|nr:membrane protein insertase YidC [Thermodesulfovibrionales bacterium]
MEKRTIIAIVLSIAILMGYQYFFVKPVPPQKAPAGVNATAPTEAGPPVGAEPVKPVMPVPPALGEQFVKVETDLYAAVFTSKGGTLKSFQLKKYADKNGLMISLLAEGGAYPALGIGSRDDFSVSGENFSLMGRNMNLSDGQTGTLVFDYAGERYSIRRTYTFYGGNYKFDLRDEVAGFPAYAITLGTGFGLSSKEEEVGTHSGPVILADTNRTELTAKKLKEAKTFTGALKWIAQEDKYFFAAIAPQTPMEEARAWVSGGAEVVTLNSSLKDGRADNSFLIYAGPKEHDKLSELGAGLEHIVDFGFFSIIARPLFWFLKFLHRFVGNWGWAIVILTIVIRIPFIPIVNKGQRAMKRLQELQPRMQEIKEKYKKDPQKMQAEMAGLYKKHKVNPMGGCLPMLLQIPVFFALYKVLLISIELRGAPFMLWVTDLSQKDPYYVLPIVMGITMVLQQKMTPSTGDPKQQKLMMFMPVIFTFMFLSFASGLVLYWLVNNILSIAQQFYINKKK